MYEKEKDKILFEEEVSVESGNYIRIGIYKYSDGDQKIGLHRKIATPSGNWKFRPIGRMTTVELQVILPILMKINNAIVKGKNE